MRYLLTVLLSACLLAVTLQCMAPEASAAAPDERALVGYPLTSKLPENAVVLFDGKDLSKWRQPDGRPAVWKVEGGAMTVTKGNIVTAETFADAFIHVEFRTPNMPGVSGQGKGNSGVYVQGRYEIQVLDSYGINIPGKGDCGAIYGQYAPLVNACRPPLAWQTYDIIFRAPRVDESGKVTERARMTVLQNGIVIQNNVELPGATAGALDENVGEPGPLLLQAHGSPVQYRNIWLVHLPPKGSDAYEPR
jgi:hypothetical protein